MRFPFLTLVLCPAALSAQGWITPRPCERCAPPCRIELPCPAAPPSVARVAGAVRVSLEDRVLRYEVDETYVNQGGGLAEADYYFPLPAGAAFQDLQLTIDGHLVSGEVMNAAEARRQYEEIVRRRRDPALVEWMGYGLLHARIFPIGPLERKRVVVRFQAVAEREGDALRVDYRGAAPAARQPVPLPARRPDRGDPDASVIAPFTLAYPRSAMYGNPYSPTQALDVRDSAGMRIVTALGGDSDVTVLLPLRRAHDAAITVLAHQPGGDDGFALITVTPPAERARAMPRDVTFVVDVSGSMAGAKLDQARSAGKRLLATLGPGDRFRIIDFSSEVHDFRDAFAAATSENLRAAGRYLDDLDASGATNIEGALHAALDPARQSETSGGSEREVRDDSRMGVVLFLTDGAPTVGERNPDALAALAARLRGSWRVFTFGVGADVNAALLEQLALEGHGTSQFVRPSEDLERVVGLVAQRLRDPVLTGVRVRADGVSLVQMLPGGPSDVFAGQDLVVLARYRGAGRARIEVDGRSGAGPVSWSTTVDFPARERGNAFVPRLWAARRIGWLSAERRRTGGSSELDEEIRTLGERYGIPTEFSSYFVREPDYANGPPMQGRPVPSSVMRDAVAPAASAPAAGVQFEAAKAASVQREARSVAAIDALGASRGGGAGGGRGPDVRRAGARVLELRDSVWTDRSYRAGMRLIKIQPYSAAYFRVLELAPELREAFAAGERVLVAGRRVAIETTPAGAAALDAGDERALRAEW